MGQVNNSVLERNMQSDMVYLGISILKSLSFVITD